MIRTERSEIFLNPSNPGPHKNERSRHHSGDAAEDPQQLRAAPEEEESDHGTHSDGGVPTEAEQQHFLRVFEQGILTLARRPCHQPAPEAPLQRQRTGGRFSC